MLVLCLALALHSPEELCRFTEERWHNCCIPLWSLDEPKLVLFVVPFVTPIQHITWRITEHFLQDYRRIVLVVYISRNDAGSGLSSLLESAPCMV